MVRHKLGPRVALVTSGEGWVGRGGVLDLQTKPRNPGCILASASVVRGELLSRAVYSLFTAARNATGESSTAQRCAARRMKA